MNETNNNPKRMQRNPQPAAEFYLILVFFIFSGVSCCLSMVLGDVLFHRQYRRALADYICFRYRRRIEHLHQHHQYPPTITDVDEDVDEEEVVITESSDF